MKHVDIEYKEVNKMTRKQLEYLLFMHKSMWKWISRKITKAKRCLDVDELKDQYLLIYETKDNVSDICKAGNCYLCYLSSMLEHIGCGSCAFCNMCLLTPVRNHDRRVSKCLNGLYRDVYFELSDYKYQARVAKQIAEIGVDMEKAKQMFGIDKSE